MPTVFLSVNFFVWIFFCWPKILGRHVSSTGSRDDTFRERRGKIDRLAVDDDVDHPRFLVRMFTQQFLSSYFTLYPSETSIELSILL